MKVIIVKNCHECPFANNDNEYGKDSCNHPEGQDVYTPLWGGLPIDSRHEDCPLTKEDVTVKADN